VIARVRIEPRHRNKRTTTPRQPAISIDHALTDPNLLGAALGDHESWSTWLAVLRAAFGLPLSQEDRKQFEVVAGGRKAPSQRVSELWAVVGRRSGKTRTAAAISVHIGAIEQHKLAPGEIGFVLLLAASRSQANVAFQYVVGFLQSSPVLRQQVVSITANEVRLRGNIIIGVHTNSYRTVRGRTLLAVVGDETSFWRDEESASPDVETFRACVPALAATRGIWIGISTGYRKLGLLYQKWRDHFGQNSEDVLVVQGDSATFNPSLDPKIIAKARADDPEAAEAEWGGGFRADIAAFLDDQTIDAAIDNSRPLELPPLPKIRYRAFCDASGGRHDAFTLCIAHMEKEGQFVCDVVRGKSAPFDPQSVVSEYATLLKDYGIKQVRGDNYAAAWVETAWQDNGIAFERAEISKSQIYLETLPIFTRGLASIPNHPRLLRELRLLERRAGRNGKDAVDHGRNGTDDYANAVCGAFDALTRRASEYDHSLDWVDGPINGARDSWNKARLLNYVRSGGRMR
jgi:hypothetical protein